MRADLHNTPIAQVLLVIILALIAYSNTFDVPFFFDDVPNVVNNPNIRDLRYYAKPDNLMDMRYISFLTFALNYRLHGLDVTGYHAVNLFIHIINGVLVYFLLLFTLRTAVPDSSTIRYSRFTGTTALFAAILFVSHPLHTQAVTYIVQRLSSLAALFCLFSLVMYIKARTARKQGEGSGLFRLQGPAFYVLSLASAVVAMKTKEIAFTLPVLIALYEFMFLEGKAKERILFLTPLLLTMVIIPVSLMGLDKPLGDLIGDAGTAMRVQTEITRAEYLFTQFRVLVTYIRLIFLPVDQNLDHDFSISHSFFEPVVALSFLFLLLLFGTSLYLFHKSRMLSVVPSSSITSDHRLRLISFGILWFFITLSVESSIIPIRDVMYEHRMYLPSVGIFAAISVSLFLAMEKLKQRGGRLFGAGMAGIAVIVVVLTATTYARNSLWKDEVAFWEDVAEKSPLKSRVHNNLGHIYSSRGLVDRAIEEYETAVRLRPDNPGARYNLGTAYMSRGSVEKAIEQFRAALQLSPDYLNAHFNLAFAYKAGGLIEKSIEHYLIVLKLNPDFSQAHVNLGNIYYSQGKMEKAMEHYREAK